ncbi:response regulator transcription factor [Arcobacter roscoffensis]|uniref:Response regulator n=1 Tax=Arcobacter roscoffensis TaxID=2961520 RepID=A0ABY5E4W7_9BACT|nr:response regulator [Arcobacter roscoffensis]UTJ05801.1 response regulator [Arcobacter roscoffensis]
MSISLKKILKNKYVLYISNKDTSYTKIIKILDIFFKKTLWTDNQKEANNLYEKVNPRVIVTDILLEKHDGFDFIKEIRKRDEKIPIIVISSKKDTTTLIKAIKLNLTDYILKPVDINSLIYALNNSAKKLLNGESHTISISRNKHYNYIDNSLYINKKIVKLTKNETILLELLLENKSSIVRIEKIKSHIWKDKEVSESAFKSLISRLSNKIGKESITNSFGIGYGIIDN